MRERERKKEKEGKSLPSLFSWLYSVTKEKEDDGLCLALRQTEMEEEKIKKDRCRKLRSERALLAWSNHFRIHFDDKRVSFLLSFLL